ncbi:HesA/MoeB/ThiF family protein [Paraburkholderia sp. RL17-381-BIF-C]|uniref:HesA/MoeB/ThiF family protein n=1 Tax=Paraburkholderia sp. RL17-381-BIF-C TaxID=3031635 RepID=UPI0038BBB223
MSEIVIGGSTLAGLVDALASDVERGAALYLNYDPISDRYLVDEVVVAGSDDCVTASVTEITFAPQFLTRVTRCARQTKRCFALLHTHPSGFLGFSPTDDATEATLVDFLNGRSDGRPCFSLVLCDGHLNARRFGEGERVTVREVGSKVVFHGAAVAGQGEQRYDRQVRAFGEDGQAILRRLNVAIVGLGGTGSVTAQQLAYLGIRQFVLVDGDTVEDTNLNRVVGAGAASVGRQKIEVAAEMIHRIADDVIVRSHVGSVMAAEAAKLLRTVDCIFICTDSHSSRTFLSAFAYQYLIPSFDIGVSINAHEGEVQAVTGRTQMLAPGLPCLWCSNALNAARIREEIMTPEERAADPYFNEGGARQPAVISINSTMVSLAVTMFLGAFTAIPARARWQSYDALTGRVGLLSSRIAPDCATCGPEGVIGDGPTKGLPFLPVEGV